MKEKKTEMIFNILFGLIIVVLIIAIFVLHPPAEVELDNATKARIKLEVDEYFKEKDKCELAGGTYIDTSRAYLVHRYQCVAKIKI